MNRTLLANPPMVPSALFPRPMRIALRQIQQRLTRLCLALLLLAAFSGTRLAADYWDSTDLQRGVINVEAGFHAADRSDAGGYDNYVHFEAIGGGTRLASSSFGRDDSPWDQWGFSPPKPYKDVRQGLAGVYFVSTSGNDWFPNSAYVIITFENGHKMRIGGGVAAHWYDEGDKLYIDQVAANCPFPSNVTPTIQLPGQAPSGSWNNTLTVPINVDDPDPSSLLRLTAVSVEGSWIIPSSGIQVFQTSNDRHYNLVLNPAFNQFGWVGIDVRCEDNFTADQTKSTSATVRLWVEIKRIFQPPTISQVDAKLPRLRAGGVTESFQVRVGDEFTPAGNLNVWTESVSSGSVAVTGRNNDLATITITTGPNPGPMTFTVKVADGDNQSKALPFSANVFPDVVANPFPSVVPGSRALNFDGLADYAYLPEATWFKEDFTIEAWVYPRTYNKGAQILESAVSPNVDNVSLSLSKTTPGALSLLVRNGTSSMTLESVAKLPLFEWTHVAATLQGRFATLYINGIEAGSGSMESPAGVKRPKTTLGASADGAKGFLDGLLDDVRIWNVARTTSEVKNGMFAKFSGAQQGLVAAYNLNEGTGKFIRNSATGNDALALGSNLTGVLQCPLWDNGVPYETLLTLSEDGTTPVSITGVTPNVWSTSTFPLFGSLGATNSPANRGANDKGIATTYTPESNFNGNDLAVLRVSGQADTTVQTANGTARVRLSVPLALKFQVQPVNDEPVVVSGSVALTGMGYLTALGTESHFVFGAKDPFTLEAWICPTVPAAGGEILGKWSPNKDGGFRMFLNPDGTVSFGRGHYNRAARDLTQADQVLTTPVAVTNGVWTHLAAVYDGQQMLIYMNGALAAQRIEDDNGAPSPAPLRIGGAESGAMFKGFIGEVRIWTIARPMNDIALGYKAPLTGKESGLYAYYTMSEGAGARAQDSASLSSRKSRYLDAKLGDQVTWVSGSGLGSRPRVVLVSEDSPGTPIAFPALDVDRIDTLEYKIVTQPSHGTVGLDPTDSGRWLYVPTPNFDGTDSFGYQVTDGHSSPKLGTVVIAIVPVNDPPTMSAISSQIIEESSDPLTIPFTVTDPDSALDTVAIRATSSDQQLLPDANISVKGSASNRTLTILGQIGSFGTVRIRIVASDGEASSSQEVLVNFIPPLAYAVLDLGDLDSSLETSGLQIDQAGRIAGYQPKALGTTDAGFVYDNYLNGGRLTFLEQGNSRVNALATASDGTTWETGYFITGGQYNAFRRTGADMAILPPPAATTELTGLGINANGTMIGSFKLAGVEKPFRLLKTEKSLTTANVLPGLASGRPTAINKSDLVVGNYVTNNAVVRAWKHDGRTVTLLPPPAGYESSYAAGVNDDGTIIGYLTRVGLRGVRDRVPAIWSPAAGAWSTLSKASEWQNTEAASVNRFGQTVGTATLANSTTTAVLYSGKSVYNLNGLLPEGTPWRLETALSINDAGQITGTATRTSASGTVSRHAYLAVPASVIGKRIRRPEGSVARLPMVELMSGSPGDDALNSFFWSEVEKCLYAIRPVTARIKWMVTTDIRDTNNITIPTLSVSTWPRDPQIHVAGAPVTVQPVPEPRIVEFAEFSYSTIPNSAVEATTKLFTTPTNVAGYTVLRYLKTFGAQPDANTQSNAFTVAKTIKATDTKYLRTSNWPVGRPITNPDHQDVPGLNGYLVFPKTPIDSTGADAAYDRSSRTGVLLPVNTVNSEAPVYDQPMIVAWYHRNPFNVAWASDPIQYTPYWPSDTSKIIIASAQGSNLGGNDPITDQTYPSARVYIQPDYAVAGFNPNEEHALLLPSNIAAPDPLVFDVLPPQSSGLQGNSVFALRNDLNEVRGYSKPYVLLKYRDPAVAEWRIKLFKVVSEEAPYFFKYPATAGTEIQPPYPLSILPLATNNYVSAGLDHTLKDYHGKIYATSAGAAGDVNSDVVIRYYYALQPDFFHPNGALPVGSVIPWLSYGNNKIDSRVPVAVNFVIKWPEERAILNVGETLTRAKHGLPGVADMARVKIVYDSLNPGITNGWQLGSNGLQSSPTNSARLYDPISERYVALDRSFKIPDTIRVQDGALGRKYFTDLPYQLRARLSFDPINKWLYFGGVLDESAVGEPLLLPNVMSTSERDRIKRLDSGATGSAFGTGVERLYQLTRNPNGLDLNRDGSADTNAVLIGLQYAVTNTVYTNGIPYPVYDTTRVVLEPLPAGFKSLTAAQMNSSAAVPQPLNALSLDGSGQHLRVTTIPSNVVSAFTIEMWLNRPQTASDSVVFSHGTDDQGLRGGFTSDSHFYVQFAGQRATTPKGYPDVDQWHHWAATYDRDSGAILLFRDGALVGETDAVDVQIPLKGDLRIGSGISASTGFLGKVDDVRYWQGVARDQSQIQAYRFSRLSSAQANLVGYWLMDSSESGYVPDSSGYRRKGALMGGASLATVTGGEWGVPLRFLSMVENDDPLLGGLPVSVKVIEIGPGPYKGDLKVLYPDNVFDERLTLRISSDFGGEPEIFTYEWYYKPDGPDFNKNDLPVLDEQGNVVDLKGWIAYTTGFGKDHNYITLGEGGESGLLTISDNWFISRYKGYKVSDKASDNVPWSAWIGDPASQSRPQPMLAEGWIKRVVRGLNPFDERVSDFVNNRASTKVSIVQQAGGRYEGDIAFNPTGDNLNRIGLIEAYETVERRGKSLSTDGSPAVNYQPANDALLFIGSRVADLYMLLGNEAMADAADPTIGFTTSSGEYGNTAASIFAFQNQLDSLLEEELALLRGRDDSSAGVQAAPVYNRLFWNFTMGDGEVAYQQVYNISDQNGDGKVDEADARIMYPQGHGDAWGHYLTAATSYYDLLRNPNFTWLPRSENVLLAGVPVKVDFLDERKFAKIAAAKAKCGSEIVDLTYRLNYVDDPNGQWQGYQDADRDRAWGVDDWASRAAVGTYLDWLMANAILPASDPDPSHTGIDKIDRTTIGELIELNTQLGAIQAQIDKADQGLNPVGLAKGVVPFDIDPSFLEIGSGVQGQTHFEQIYGRALSAVQNAVSVFDEVNGNSNALRANQDTVEEFSHQVEEQERDYKNRLIEIYGYPYAGDIGPGKTFPSGYDGPDLLHHMYIPTKEISDSTAPPSDAFTAFLLPLKTGFTNAGLTFPDDRLLGTNGATLASVTYSNSVAVDYPISAANYAFVAPASWGQRRAPGELQSAMSDLVQEEARFKQALRNYDNLILSIRDKLQKVQGEINVTSNQIAIKEKAQGKLTGLNAGILTATALKDAMGVAANRAERLAEATADGLPKAVGTSTDPSGPGRAALKTAGEVAGTGFRILEAGADSLIAGFEMGKEQISLQEDIDLDTVALKGEKQAEMKEILELIREEAPLRIELYNQREVVQQTAGRYQSTLASGQRVLEERLAFRKKTAGEATKLRYRDMAFRIFRNDAIQKYRAQFDLAARYTYLAATAYDYESNLIGNDGKAGRKFLTEIVRQRSLGQIRDGNPVPGRFGLADPLARMNQNFSVLKTQMGFNNPQHEENSFSLRSELFRIHPHSDDSPDAEADQLWRDKLNQSRVADLWQVPQFRRYCRPMAPESAGPQPGLVIKFPTTVTFGLNYFGWPLGGGDSAYDPSQFATKIRSAGVWFSGYNGNGLSFTPRVYLVPTGADVLRSPNGDNFDVRLWRVVDQKLPLPFPISQADMKNAAYIPAIDNLGGEIAQIRKYSSFRAYHDAGADTDQMSTDSRLIGRSVWNTEWMLIIPGGTLLNNPDAGLDTFIESINDIRFSFLTYAYSGN